MNFRITCLLLIPAIFTVTLNRSLICMAFFLKKEYISSVLCENRQNPKLKCEGNCFLKNKLQETENKQQTQNISIKFQFDWMGAEANVRKTAKQNKPEFCPNFGSNQEMQGYLESPYNPPETFALTNC